MVAQERPRALLEAGRGRGRAAYWGWGVVNDAGAAEVAAVT